MTDDFASHLGTTPSRQIDNCWPARSKDHHLLVIGVVVGSGAAAVGPSISSAGILASSLSKHLH